MSEDITLNRQGKSLSSVPKSHGSSSMSIPRPCFCVRVPVSFKAFLGIWVTAISSVRRLGLLAHFGMLQYYNLYFDNVELSAYLENHITQLIHSSVAPRPVWILIWISAVILFVVSVRITPGERTPCDALVAILRKVFSTCVVQSAFLEDAFTKSALTWTRP